MYFILYFIREAVNLPMPFLILLSSLPLTEKTVKVIFLLSIISRTLTIRYDQFYFGVTGVGISFTVYENGIFSLKNLINIGLYFNQYLYICVEK